MSRDRARIYWSFGRFFTVLGLALAIAVPGLVACRYSARQDAQQPAETKAPGRAAHARVSHQAPRAGATDAALPPPRARSAPRASNSGPNPAKTAPPLSDAERVTSSGSSRAC